MVSFEEIQAAYYMVAATGVLVAAVFYVLNLRISSKNQELMLKSQEQSTKAQQLTLETRQAQLFMQIYDRFFDANFLKNYELVLHQDWKDYEDYIQKYGPENNPETFNTFQTLATFFQGVGILVERGLVDLELIHDFVSATTMGSWEKVKPIVYGLRKERGDPYILWAMEQLYVKVKKYREANPVPKMGSLSNT